MTTEVFFYMGKPLDSYSKEELINIAEEGWTSYLKHVEQSIASTKLMADLMKAARSRR